MRHWEDSFSSGWWGRGREARPHQVDSRDEWKVEIVRKAFHEKEIERFWRRATGGWAISQKPIRIEWFGVERRKNGGGGLGWGEGRGGDEEGRGKGNHRRGGRVEISADRRRWHFIGRDWWCAAVSFTATGPMANGTITSLGTGGGGGGGAAAAAAAAGGRRRRRRRRRTGWRPIASSWGCRRSWTTNGRASPAPWRPASMPCWAPAPARGAGRAGGGGWRTPTRPLAWTVPRSLPNRPASAPSVAALATAFGPRTAAANRTISTA